MLTDQYTELINVSRDQLLEYPKLNLRKDYKRITYSLLKRKKMPNDRFFWPNGLLATSLEWSHRFDSNVKDIDALKMYYNNWINKGLPIKNADYTINGYSLMYLYSINKNEEYLNAIKFLINYLKHVNKTEEKSIPYRENNPNRVLIDSLGMVCPFLSRYGATFNDKESIDLAVVQLTNFLKLGMDEVTDLPYHGYDVQEKVKLGIVGWGRAIGWQLIGLVDSLEYIPTSHKSYEFLKTQFQQIVDNVTDFQNSEGNFAWQVTSKDGYSDSSATSMIMYAIKRGIMLNLLSESYLENVELAVGALYSQIENGKVENCSAECRGISMYPQIYGNYPWAQGPTTSLLAISKKQL